MESRDRWRLEQEQEGLQPTWWICCIYSYSIHLETWHVPQLMLNHERKAAPFYLSFFLSQKSLKNNVYQYLCVKPRCPLVITRHGSRRPRVVLVEGMQLYCTSHCCQEHTPVLLDPTHMWTHARTHVQHQALFMQNPHRTESVLSTFHINVEIYYTHTLMSHFAYFWEDPLTRTPA